MTTSSLWTRFCTAVSRTFLAVACFVTRADLDLALESNRVDRLTILFNAALLACAGLVQSLVWPGFFCSFLPALAGIPMGLLVAAIVFLMDQAIAASYWELSGVLRTRGYDWKHLATLGGRALLALALSWVGAIGATLWLFRGTIDQRMVQDRTKQNAVVEAEYTARRAELSARMVEPVEKELAARREQRAALQRRFDTAGQERDAEAKNVSNARLEADRQLDGGLHGYVRGDGPLRRDALRRQREADLLRAAAAAEMRDSRERVATLDREIATLTTALQEQTDKLGARSVELDAEKHADSRWSPPANDPILRHAALKAIKADPVKGPAAREFGFMMNALLLVLELSYLFVKVFCAPASVYTVRLITRTKREAAAVSVEFARDLTEIHGQRPLRAVRISEEHVAAEPGERP
jgi:hypothetical protein